MNIEEYKSLRDEMLQRFRWNAELLVFAIVSTGGLLSWVFIERDKITQGIGPFLFTLVGLGVTGFIFYAYLDVLKANYNMGSYLAVFYEGNKKEFAWHSLSRFHYELVADRGSNKRKWGSEGRRGGRLLLLLTIANFFGPYLLTEKNINIFPIDWRKDWLTLLVILSVLLLVIWIVRIARSLLNTETFMENNLREWRLIKRKLIENPGLLEATIGGRLNENQTPKEAP